MSQQTTGRWVQDGVGLRWEPGSQPIDWPQPMEDKEWAAAMHAMLKDLPAKPVHASQSAVHKAQPTEKNASHES